MNTAILSCLSLVFNNFTRPLVHCTTEAIVASSPNTRSRGSLQGTGSRLSNAAGPLARAWAVQPTAPSPSPWCTKLLTHDGGRMIVLHPCGKKILLTNAVRYLKRAKFACWLCTAQWQFASPVQISNVRNSVHSNDEDTGHPELMAVGRSRPFGRDALACHQGCACCCSLPLVHDATQLLLNQIVLADCQACLACSSLAGDMSV